MSEKEAYPDGLYVKLSCGDQQIRKKLIADGDNQISLEGVTVSIDRNGYAVTTQHVSAGGGASSANRKSVGFGGVGAIIAAGGIAVGRTGSSGGVATTRVGAAVYGVAGGVSGSSAQGVSCGNILSANNPPKKVTIHFGDDALKE